jgi:DNA-binding GntR family transcriptional regulator
MRRNQVVRGIIFVRLLPIYSGYIGVMPRTKARREQGTLAGRAYRLLKHAIVRGELPEGGFLVESEILARYGIGRTPFREACNRLHNEQLLEVVPRRGYLVPELTFRGVRDLLEARILIEGMGGELAAHLAEPAEVERSRRTSCVLFVPLRRTQSTR